MSNETKWTPGPWVALTNGYYWQVSPENKSEKDPYEVCDVCSSEPSKPEGGLQEANARLIAAAPELYEALRVSVEVLEKTANDTLIGRNAAEVGRTVLAKARGETE